MFIIVGCMVLFCRKK